MRRRIAAIILGFFALLVAACGSSEVPDNAQPVPESTQQSVTQTSPAHGTVQAIIDTEGTGCDKASGDCWLPPYPIPYLNPHGGGPTPHFAQQKAGTPCSLEAQANCWPQPGDEVTIECLTQGSDGLLYYGFRVTPEHMPDNNPSATGIVTYNQAQWFRIKKEQHFTTLSSSCPAVGG